MTHRNPIDEWYSSDRALKEIIDKLSTNNLTPEEQAKQAFIEISDLYSLPKYPEEITEEMQSIYEEVGIDEPRSVFEEIGIIRYLEPDDDPRGVLMLALYNVKNMTYLDIELCAERHFEGQENIPTSYMVYYTGNDIDSKLNFLGKNETWTKPGVKYASKILRLE